MRLLIVDDDELFRQELADLLSQDGHEVEVAPSVPKAVTELENADFDLVLTDLKMPRHSGMELLREIRKRWPRTLVVMITGFATVETAVEAMKAGAFDYLRKPFEIEDVRDLLLLAAEQRRFHEGRDGDTDPLQLARRWNRQDRLDVLLVTDRSVPPEPGLTVAPLERDGSLGVRGQVEGFRDHHDRFGLVLEGIEGLIESHRREDVLRMMDELRTSMEGKGPLAVFFDPRRITNDDVLAIRAAVVAPQSHATLEALANPIRRSVLRRLAAGSCSFMEAMHEAGIHDSPKFSFHLRKLQDEGLIVHSGEEYRITPKGREAVAVLDRLDTLAGAEELGNRVLPFQSHR